jgi:LacI family transcriptional regulator
VNVKRQLDFWQPVGVIAECGSGASELNAESFGTVPAVYFDADRAVHGPGCYVTLDSEKVGALAAEHLLSLDLPHYAFAAFRLPLFWARERCEAFVEAVQRSRGCGVSVFDPGREQVSDVRQQAMEEWVRSLPRPCGVFAANDYVGEEIANICARMGISVPGDIAILGVDDDEQICENTMPTLSSIAPDFAHGGYLAAEMLGRLVDGDGPRNAFLRYEPGTVVVRQSTRHIAGSCERIADAVEMIRRRACEGISAKDVASYIGVPRRTAEMQFRAATGRSIHQEIDEVRFAKVFALLKNPRQTLDAIPDLCGFSTCVALRKAFKLRTGLSMREWRARNVPALAQK